MLKVQIYIVQLISEDHITLFLTSSLFSEAGTGLDQQRISDLECLESNVTPLESMRLSGTTLISSSFCCSGP